MGAYIQNGDKWVFSTRSDKILDADNGTLQKIGFGIAADNQERIICKGALFFTIKQSEKAFIYTRGQLFRHNPMPVKGFPL